MTSVILLPDALGIDAATLPPLAAVKAAGYQFVNVYVGGSHDERDKIQAIWDNLMVVNLNYERREDAYLGGYTAGRAQAIDALNEARQYGWNGESPIIFSGTDTTVLDYGLADSFYRGIQDVFGNLPWGAYGDHIYLGHLSQQSWVNPGTVFWQWMNNGPTLDYATIRQTGHGTVAGMAVDINKVKKPLRFWSGLGPDHVITKDTHMFRHDPNGTVYEILMGHKIHCDGPYFYDVLGGSIYPDTSGKVISYPGAGIEQLPDWPFATVVPVPNPAPTHFAITLTGSADA